VRRRNRYPSRTLFRRIVNLVIGLERTTMLLRHHLRDRRRQRRLPVIHMADRTNIQMRLRSLKLFL
jgi:hypothetical protein